MFSCSRAHGSPVHASSVPVQTKPFYKTYVLEVLLATPRDQCAVELLTGLSGLDRALMMRLGNEEGCAVSQTASLDGAGLELVGVEAAVADLPVDGVRITEEDFVGVDL